MESIEALLLEWLERRSDQKSIAWLRDRIAETPQAAPERRVRAVETAFPRTARLFGHAALSLDDDDLAAAHRLRPDWAPRAWTTDDTARALLLLALARVAQNTEFVAVFRRLRQAADPSEQIALFRSLPLLKHSEPLEAEAAEGLRTNIPDVFAAIAHHNPFPSEAFDEARWNQMILKALFIGCALAPIQGLDARANLPLAIMLRDFARERQAAGRETPPELWRCLAPFAKEAGALDDLRLAPGEPEAQHEAAREL